jgi:hypothetical protein
VTKEPQRPTSEPALERASESRVRTLISRGPALHEWLLLALLVWMTDHYRWLMDDAFIYFRYADNLLFLDRGLVYNAGEYVEGFSSPLWMMLLLPLRALELDYYTIVRVIAGACAVSYGAALIWLNRRLSPNASAVSVVNFPLAASAAHYGLTTHFSSGLETPLVQLTAPLFAAALLCPLSPLLQCCVALAPLVRPECGLLWLAYVPWVVVTTRRVPIWFVASALVANAAWLLFRVYYYADFLPNTFYLKDMARWDWGLLYWQNVLDVHRWPWVLAGLCVCAWLGRRFLATTPRALRFVLLAVALLHAAYVARVGGDMLYHRYAALPVCLVLCASAGLIEAALLQLQATGLRVWLAPVVSLAIALSFGLAYPPQLSGHPYRADVKARKWRGIADAHWHRQHPSLMYNATRTAEDARHRELYARQRAADGDAPIIADGFCRQGFRRSDAYVINSYGLTDALLARLPREFGRPGHKLVSREAEQLKSLKERAHREHAPWQLLPKAPAWLQTNRDAIDKLNRKIHNQHKLAENMRVALTPIHFTR